MRSNKKESTHDPTKPSPVNSKNCELTLAYWTIYNPTWQLFAKTEKKLRNADSAYLFIGILIAGSIGLMSASNLSFCKHFLMLQ